MVDVGDFDAEGNIQSSDPTVRYKVGVVWIDEGKLDEARRFGWQETRRKENGKDGIVVAVWRNTAGAEKARRAISPPDHMTTMYAEATKLADRKICTAHIYPPIPVRIYDWTAWSDDVGEEGPAGYGATEAEAIADLLDNHGEEND